MATVAGVNVKTVARGRKELLSKEIDFERIHRQGAERPPLKKRYLNGFRLKHWKYYLHEEICKKHGIDILVCHYPTVASKWNPVEH
jgi:hypothetical protein